MDTNGTKHTPGPWRLVNGDIHDHGDDGEENGFSILMGDYQRGGGRAIHRIQYAEDTYPENPGHAEAFANARLIAAAPELLAALEMLNEIDGAYGIDLNEQQRDQLHDALRKARRS